MKNCRQKEGGRVLFSSSNSSSSGSSSRHQVVEERQVSHMNKEGQEYNNDKVWGTAVKLKFGVAGRTLVIMQRATRVCSSLA